MDIDGFLEVLYDDPLVNTSDVSCEGSDDAETPAFFRDPSHVCRSCGEEYNVDPDLEIGTCRSCGGVKVERA